MGDDHQAGHVVGRINRLADCWNGPHCRIYHRRHVGHRWGYTHRALGYTRFPFSLRARGRGVHGLDQACDHRIAVSGHRAGPSIGIEIRTADGLDRIDDHELCHGSSLSLTGFLRGRRSVRHSVPHGSLGHDPGFHCRRQIFRFRRSFGGRLGMFVRQLRLVSGGLSFTREVGRRCAGLHGREIRYRSHGFLNRIRRVGRRRHRCLRRLRCIRLGRRKLSRLRWSWWSCWIWRSCRRRCLIHDRLVVIATGAAGTHSKR